MKKINKTIFKFLDNGMIGIEKYNYSITEEYLCNWHDKEDKEKAEKEKIKKYRVELIIYDEEIQYLSGLYKYLVKWFGDEISLKRVEDCFIFTIKGIVLK